jgi:hypothetical protein
LNGIAVRADGGKRHGEYFVISSTRYLLCIVMPNVGKNGACVARKLLARGHN